jgi:thiol-disulfide isomerase/thioredoxin
MMQHRWHAVFAATLLSLLSVGGGASAQAPAGGEKRAEIEAKFREELVKAEVVKIKMLGELAAALPKAEAGGVYNDLFRFAITVDLYEAAEPFAEKVLGETGHSPETMMLAHMVNTVSETTRGAFDESLASLTKAVQPATGAGVDREQLNNVLPLSARMSLLNTYIQRLLHAGRYDIAKKALALIAGVAQDPEMKNLVASRVAAIELVGKPAPAIRGTDLDGKPFDLAAYKGDVVLVVFWASWCTPNVREAAAFEELMKKYGPKGFKIVGINLDTHQDGGVPVSSVMSDVRRFVLEHNLSWPNLISDMEANDYAKLYGVTQVPSDVVIARDGTIVHLDKDVDSLEKLLPGLLAR